MKKILLVFLFMFIALFSFSQEWQDIPNFTDMLWQDYGLDVETYFEDQSGYLGFVDYEVQDRVYMTRIMSYLLSSIEDFLWYEESILFEESGIQGFLYLTEVRTDYFSKAGNTREIELEVSREWLLQYYSSGVRTRNSMLIELVNMYF